MILNGFQVHKTRKMMSLKVHQGGVKVVGFLRVMEYKGLIYKAFNSPPTLTSPTHPHLHAHATNEWFLRTLVTVHPVALKPRSHQFFRPVPTVKLLRTMFTNRWQPITFHVITTGICWRMVPSIIGVINSLLAKQTLKGTLEIVGRNYSLVAYTSKCEHAINVWPS